MLAVRPPTRAVARVGYEQLSGGLAVLSQVQVFVPFGWVATMRNETGSPVQLEKTTPADVLNPGNVEHALE